MNGSPIVRTERAHGAAIHEWGLHPITGTHAYRAATETPRPRTIPTCGICGGPGPLYAGVCAGCDKDDEEGDRDR